MSERTETTYWIVVCRKRDGRDGLPIGQQYKRWDREEWARDEATRLATQNPHDTFTVFEAKACVRSVSIQVTEYTEDIPF